MNAIANASANSIGRGIERAAALWRDKPALRFKDRVWTFTELANGAKNVAARLTKMGLKKGDRVAAFGRNTDAYYLLWLGCVEGGFIHVPIGYSLAGQELLYIINQSGARALFHDASLAPPIIPIRGKIRADFVELLAEDEHRFIGGLRYAPTTKYEAPLIEAGDIAQIMYTSGTTSAPKGAMMSHGAMMAQYQSCIQGLDYTPDDRCLAALPLYHTAQMQAFNMPQTLVGAYIHLIDAAAPEEVFALIRSERLSSFFAPPTVWINLLRHPAFDPDALASLRKIYYGASIMPAPVLQELRERLPQAGVYNVYGQTEIAPVATVLRPLEHLDRPKSAGRPVLNVQTRIVDENMNDVEVGAHGEIVHRSPQLLSGYWEKPDETEAAFTGDWFHSGDVGYFDTEGYIFIVDRVRDVINTGGVLVSSREVEEALYTHPGVEEVAVIALPDDKWIEAVVAVIVPRAGTKPSSEDLIAHARAHLAPFKAPKRIELVTSLPKNASGKILKRELRTRFATKAN